MAKGSAYEREICKLLSKWWTHGEDDAVFWRSSQSGGRATQRAKSGKATFGSYGDIAAVNPIGQPLLQMFTLELKRGRSHGCPNDELDCRRTKKPKPFEQALMQVLEGARLSKSVSWMLISRRDGRESMAYVDRYAATLLPTIFTGPTTRFDVQMACGQYQFVGLRLAEFLERVRPESIVETLSFLRPKP